MRVTCTVALAGSVSPNKRKSVLKTLEQLDFVSIETYFSAIDNLVIMSSCIEFAIQTLLIQDLQSGSH